MFGPIVFISHSKVKEGKLEALQEFSREMFPVIQAEKPETVLQYGYVNEEGTDAHFVHVFPDADAMDAHMIGAAERTGKATEFIETYQFEIYGAPSAETLSMLRQAPGVDVAVRPVGLGGYIRLGDI
jgi:quinol monooxygenase YgiN